jgi:hypothetical protein
MRVHTYSLFSKIGTLEEAVRLTHHLEAESAGRASIFIALSRYNHDTTNEHLRTLLTECKEPDVLDFVLPLGFAKYHRYDFLPELHALRKRLKAVTDPLQASTARRLVTDIDETIAELNRDKEQNLPIGLPLDWPNTKHSDAAE